MNIIIRRRVNYYRQFILYYSLISNFSHFIVKANSNLYSTTTMAWQCSGNNNDELINNLRNGSLINNNRVEDAMRKTDRAYYTPKSGRPYEDAPQYLGNGATISAPHMHAMALELLEDRLRPGMKALDVGSGSGYLTACMGRMVAPNGQVFGVEHVPKLVEMSKNNLLKDDPKLIESHLVTIKQTDGRIGLKDHGPYDAIHVGAAAENVPKELLDQLNINGKMVVPVGPEDGFQELVLFERKSDNDFKRSVITGVRYVPLTSLEKQTSRW